jgi:hypothetical protein
MGMMEKILPSEANNNYQGHKIALYGLILFTFLMTWRSCIHLFFAEYGMHSIAHFIVFEGVPDPNLAIYLFFSLWGLQQLLFCLINIIVLFRYRSFIPLMFLFWLLEWSLRPLVVGNLHLLGEQYFTGNTPGMIGTPYAVIFLIVMLILSLIPSK